ncbi:unnamed protein product, partial [Mesorhabditis spiculigera]
MDQLPRDVLTRIFSDFTYADQTATLSLVCKVFSEVIRAMKPHFFDSIPSEVLLRVFDNFDLRERASLVRVDRRFRDLIVEKSSGVAEVNVLNIFEEHIWLNSVRRNSSRQKVITVENPDELINILRYIKNVSAAKVWYESSEFGQRAIDQLADSKMKMSCVDVYPYAPEQILDYLDRKLPELGALTMRPHGQNVWNGVRMTQMPAFNGLRTLIMDNFDIGGDTPIEFPPNVTTFEFSNRGTHHDPPQWVTVAEKLYQMPLIEFLGFSHARFNTIDDLSRFLRLISREKLEHLRFLALKFCKFPSLRPIVDGGEPERMGWRQRMEERERERERAEREQAEEIVAAVLKDHEGIRPLEELEGISLSLQWLKLELCDGRLSEVMHVFTNVCCTLQMALLSMINDLEALRDLNTVAPLLERLNIWTHLSFLTKAPINYPKPTSFFKRILPSPALFSIVTKIEASFADDPAFFDNYLMAGTWPRVHELKLINCDEASNEFLMHMNTHSLLLRKMILIRCRRITEQAMIPFVEQLHLKSRDIMVTWKADKLHLRPTSLYLALCATRAELMRTKRMRLRTKKFSESDGIEVWIQDKGTGRKVTFRDFDDNDSGRIVSISVRTPFSIRRMEEEALEKEKEREARIKELEREMPPQNPPDPVPSTSTVADPPPAAEAEVDEQPEEEEKQPEQDNMEA